MNRNTALTVLACLVAVALALPACVPPLTMEEHETDDIDADPDAGESDADESGADENDDDESDDDEEPPGPGTSLGTFENTYYILADETSHEGPAVANLYAPGCELIATVSQPFADSACIQGSAVLADDRVINYHSPCSCGGPCTYCWSVLDPEIFPWGKGSQNNPLEPFRSWAVDTSIISHGSLLYVEEWDGMELPDIDGLGGYAHDGCFRADDVGGAINDYHVDIFAGTRAMWLEMEQIFPTRSTFVVYGDSPRCEHLEND